MKDSDGVMFS